MSDADASDQFEQVASEATAPFSRAWMAERRGHPELVTYADLGIDPVGRGYAPARAGDRGGQQPPVPVGQQVVDDGVVEQEEGEGELGGVADATG